eukprot:c39896_g1_i1 orf=275-445(+)
MNLQCINAPSVDMWHSSKNSKEGDNLQTTPMQVHESKEPIFQCSTCIFKGDSSFHK